MEELAEKAQRKVIKHLEPRHSWQCAPEGYLQLGFLEQGEYGSQVCDIGST